jgi:hypothetical protein
MRVGSRSKERERSSWTMRIVGEAVPNIRAAFKRLWLEDVLSLWILGLGKMRGNIGAWFQTLALQKSALQISSVPRYYLVL